MPAYNDLNILSYFFELVNTFLNNFFGSQGANRSLIKNTARDFRRALGGNENQTIFYLKYTRSPNLIFISRPRIRRLCSDQSKGLYPLSQRNSLTRFSSFCTIPFCVSISYSVRPASISISIASRSVSIPSSLYSAINRLMLSPA